MVSLPILLLKCIFSRILFLEFLIGALKMNLIFGRIINYAVPIYTRVMLMAYSDACADFVKLIDLQKGVN